MSAPTFQQPRQASAGIAYVECLDPDSVQHIVDWVRFQDTDTGHRNAPSEQVESGSTLA